MTINEIIACIKKFAQYSGDYFEAIIGASALFLAVWQGLLQRRHNKLSVGPHLSFDRYVQNIEPQIRLSLSNHGIGPAIIKSFTVYIDGVSLTTTCSDFWRTAASKLAIPIVWGGGQVFSVGDAVPAGQSRDVYLFKTLENGKDVNFNSANAHKELDRVRVVMKYESIYGDVFTATTGIAGTNA